MPRETSQAIEWALQQQYKDILGDMLPVTKTDPMGLSTKVREYFNSNNITYATFSYEDLKPYL